jgi:hypothetical protein
VRAHAVGRPTREKEGHRRMRRMCRCQQRCLARRYAGHAAAAAAARTWSESSRRLKSSSTGAGAPINGEKALFPFLGRVSGVMGGGGGEQSGVRACVRACVCVRGGGAPPLCVCASVCQQPRKSLPYMATASGERAASVRVFLRVRRWWLRPEAASTPRAFSNPSVSWTWWHLVYCIPTVFYTRVAATDNTQISILNRIYISELPFSHSLAGLSCLIVIRSDPSVSSLESFQSMSYVSVKAQKGSRSTGFDQPGGPAGHI